MTYQKFNLEVPNIGSAVGDALAQNSVVIEGLADELEAAGAVVQLDTGDRVWVSCVVHDRPETIEIDLMTVALALDADGTPRRKSNGQLVAHAFWHKMMTAPLVERGIDTVRKALMMVALGEPQPQVPIQVPAVDGPTEQDAVPMATPEAHSIRSQISAADELSAPLADVL